MKNDVTDKSIMRRYLDDMYTQEEARGLLSRLKDDILPQCMWNWQQMFGKKPLWKSSPPAWSVKNIRKKPVGY